MQIAAFNEDLTTIQDSHSKGKAYHDLINIPTDDGLVSLTIPHRITSLICQRSINLLGLIMLLC